MVGGSGVLSFGRQSLRWLQGQWLSDVAGTIIKEPSRYSLPRPVLSQPDIITVISSLKS